MVIAWSRISSKSIATLLVLCGLSGTLCGLGDAVRGHVYHSRLGKESGKWGRTAKRACNSAVLLREPTSVSYGSRSVATEPRSVPGAGHTSPDGIEWAHVSHQGEDFGTGGCGKVGGEMSRMGIRSGARESMA